MYVSVLVMALPEHRHLKFSHVLGQTSVNNSNTILPAKGRGGGGGGRGRGRGGRTAVSPTVELIQSGHSMPCSNTTALTGDSIDGDVQETPWKRHVGAAAQQVSTK